MTRMKFGRRNQEKPAFEINGLMFSGLPLSLAEERGLAEVGEEGSESDMLDSVMDTLSHLLNARAQDKQVDVAWLTENLAPADVEGIISYLRTDTLVSP